VVAQLSTAVTVALENVVRIFGTEGQITLPNPWLCNRVEPDQGKIIVQRKGEPAREINIETSVTSYSFEADVVGNAILSGAKQAPAPAMSWDDSLGNIRTLDLWRESIGLTYESELPGAYRQRYEWGTAYGAHCLILALDRPLTDVYWLNITDPGYPFMALVEHTNMRSPEEYGGRHLVYLGMYRPMSDPIFSTSREAIVASVAPYLSRINASFDASWITDSWAFGAPFAQPIVTVDYREHIPPFDTPIPGVFMANMFQVYPHDRGQNYSVGLAERLVEALSR